MPEYDFKILQFNEFECLCRDLLQKKEKNFIESFTDGRDGGIDLRFAYSKSHKTIIQVKRYKDYGELKGVLKKEVEKVKKLNPTRYILMTSVGLTPKNKREINTIYQLLICSTVKASSGYISLSMAIATLYLSVAVFNYLFFVLLLCSTDGEQGKEHERTNNVLH